MSENSARVFPRLPSVMPAGRNRTSIRLATPLALSLCFHGALFAALAMVTWSLVHTPGAPEPDLSLDLAPAPRRAEVSSVPPAAQADRPVSAPADAAPPLPAPQNAPWLDAPGPVPVPAVPAPTPTSLNRPPDASGVDFAGVQARDIRSVVFVIDASGPSASCLPLVVDELRRSLSRLTAAQQFQVLVTRDQSAFAPGAAPVEACPLAEGLLSASAASKAGALDWLRSVRPSGRPDPVSGLEEALALRPDVVYLLSRSIARTEASDWPAEMDAILRRLEAMNPPDARGRPRTLIRAVQFIDEDPTGLMPEIARRHGGIEGYALRTLDDLAQGDARQAAAIEADRRVDLALAMVARHSESGALARAMLAQIDGAGAQALRSAAAEAERALAGAPDEAWTRIVRARTALARAAGEAGEARSRALANVRAAVADLETRSAGAMWMRDLALAWAEPGRMPPGPSAEAPEAFAGEARVLAMARGGEFDPDDPLGAAGHGALDLLAREVACAALVRRAEEGKRAWGDIDRPWRRWLTPGAAPLPGLAPEDSRAWVLRRLGEQIPAEAPLAELSPEAHFASGLGQSLAAGTDAQAARAEAALRDLLSRDDAEALHGDAMLALGTMLVRQARPVKQAQGVEWLITRAEAMPEAPGEWTRARDAAAGLGREAQGPSERRMALTTLESVLSRGRETEALRGRVDWAEDHARVLLELAPLHEPAMAMSLLERVPEGSSRLGEAASQYGALAWPEVDRLRAELEASPPGEAREATREQLVERLARAIEVFKRAGQSGPLARARLACAGAVRDERPDLAADLYRAVIESGEVPVGGLPQLRVALGECLRDTGERALAMQAIGPELEGEPGPEAFWLAWALALEIQRDENPEGERSAAILERIRTLRAIDPALGEASTRVRIEAVEAAPRR